MNGRKLRLGARSKGKRLQVIQINISITFFIKSHKKGSMFYIKSQLTYTARDFLSILVAGRCVGPLENYQPDRILEMSNMILLLFSIHLGFDTHSVPFGLKRRSIIPLDWSGDKTNVNVYCLRSVYLPYCLAMPYRYSRDKVNRFCCCCCWRKMRFRHSVTCQFSPQLYPST